MRRRETPVILGARDGREGTEEPLTDRLLRGPGNQNGSGTNGTGKHDHDHRDGGSPSSSPIPEGFRDRYPTGQRDSCVSGYFSDSTYSLLMEAWHETRARLKQRGQPGWSGVKMTLLIEAALLLALEQYEREGQDCEMIQIVNRWLDAPGGIPPMGPRYSRGSAGR